MLVLTRKQQEQLVIEVAGRTVLVRVIRARAGAVRLGISVPEDVAVHREETWKHLNHWHGLSVDTSRTAASESHVR
jgi:carbon storage regulator CsrA